MQIIPSFLVDKASCTRQFESELSLHSLASLFPIKEGIFSNPSVSLSKGSSTSNQAFLLRRKDVTGLLGARNRYAIRLSDHQRSSPCCAGWDRLESNEVLTFATKLRLIDIHCLICNNSSLIADICWGDITDTITTSSVIRITL